MFLLLISTSTKANIYWLYEFYNISPNFNIFSLTDDNYQQCLQGKLSKEDYKKAIEFKSSITQEMENAADQCVEKLLGSQSNTGLQQCLKSELSDQSYNSLITKQFSKDPKKNDFKVFYKCLSELETDTAVASSEQYNESNSCPMGYKLINNSCQPDELKKKTSEQKDERILNDEEAYGSKKFYADMWLNTMDEISYLLRESQISNKQKYFDIVTNAISIFKRMENATPEQQKYTGKQLIEVKNLLEKNFKKNKDIEKYKDVLMKISGIMTGGRPPADVFLANKVYECKSYSKPFFTHHVTNLKKIKKILPWGSVRSGGGARVLKPHTYMVIKNKGSEVLVHVPTDSYLIAYDKYRLYEFKDTIHYMLYFQASCDVAYRFDHLDTIESSLQKKMGELVLQEIQNKSKIMPIRPPIFIKAGELVAKTKGVPKSGWWDFGLYNKNNNNQLPKRLSEWKDHEVERTFRAADCPYDYFVEDLKKAYYKKIKKKRCGPKEIK